MALPLDEIKWDEPILPSVPDPAWEAEVARRGGHVFEVDRRIAASRWLREACFSVTSYRAGAIPDRLMRIGAMVTAQENACRYCYGANRAYMKVLGYSEAFIQGVERDLHMAEINDKERGFIAFCRNLARSRPRPSRAAVDGLLALGYSRPEVNEMAFVISVGCFYNRVSTLIACPPEQKFERMANGPVGRMMGLAAPLLRAFALGKRRTLSEPPLDHQALARGRFAPILLPLAGLPAARVMKSALDGAFECDVIDGTTKALMFAVIARTLGCPHCESEATKLLLAADMNGLEIEAALATLQSNRLGPRESGLLSWARDTVYYETSEIQRKTRALAAAVGDSVVLEAIGVASLANATVRLAMLLE
jgi:alkylhydroperoxidase family enzyme